MASTGGASVGRIAVLALLQNGARINPVAATIPMAATPIRTRGRCTPVERASHHIPRRSRLVNLVQLAQANKPPRTSLEQTVLYITGYLSDTP